MCSIAFFVFYVLESYYYLFLCFQRSFEYEELMRPVTEFISAKKRRPLPSSSSSDDSEEEYAKRLLSRQSRKSRKSR